jgi:hypothetical protein
LIGVLENRAGDRHSAAEVQGLAEMAEGWSLSAVRMFFRRGERSLVEYFDEVVAACVQSSSTDLGPLLAPGLGIRTNRPRRSRASH